MKACNDAFASQAQVDDHIARRPAKDTIAIEQITGSHAGQLLLLLLLRMRIIFWYPPKHRQQSVIPTTFTRRNSRISDPSFKLKR